MVLSRPVFGNSRGTLEVSAPNTPPVGVGDVFAPEIAGVGVAVFVGAALGLGLGDGLGL